MKNLLHIESEKDYKYQIVVPVFNEEKILNRILKHAKDNFYLENIVIANDASIDSSKEILRKWENEEDLKVNHLEVNRNKEGAILDTLIKLKNENRLLPYTILLDADTMLSFDKLGMSVHEQINQAIQHLNDNNYGAMALRVNATYYDKPNIPYLSSYAIYYGLQFDCWLIGKNNKLWVINGAGGIFKSDELIDVIKCINKTFETGDLEITVEYMKRGRKIQLYNNIEATTFVPDTFLKLFNQRRRWERGTTKVIWNELFFYTKQLLPPNFLGLALILHFALYVGLIFTILAIFKDNVTNEILLDIMLMSFLFWLAVDYSKGAYIAYINKKRDLYHYLLAALINAPIWILIVIPARLFGFTEAIKDIYLKKGK